MRTDSGAKPFKCDLCGLCFVGNLNRHMRTHSEAKPLKVALRTHTMPKLNVAYNNAFRFMHHLPTYCNASVMFVVNRVPNCRAVIRNRIYGFMKRLVSSSNALGLSTVTSDARFLSRIVRHWLKSLYIHVDAG